MDAKYIQLPWNKNNDNIDMGTWHTSLAAMGVKLETEEDWSSGSESPVKYRDGKLFPPKDESSVKDAHFQSKTRM